MKRRSRLCLFSLMVCLAITSCGGRGSQHTDTPTLAPPTRTPFPTFAFVEPTTAPVFEQSDEAASTTLAEVEVSSRAAIELDPTKVARGRGRFEVLGCTGCHGDDGAGTDRGKRLLDFALSEEDFITFMRTGGELGTRHQFSTDRLSDSGSRNLYQYLVSLAADG